jgi:hypothetical protein
VDAPNLAERLLQVLRPDALETRERQAAASPARLSTSLKATRAGVEGRQPGWEASAGARRRPGTANTRRRTP